MALIHSRKEKCIRAYIRAGIGGQSRDGIWLLDDDASMLKALGRLMNSAGFIAEKFKRSSHLSRQAPTCPMPRSSPGRMDASNERFGSAGLLRRDSPETRIIFISGRDDPLVRQHALDAELSPFSQNLSMARILCGSFEKLKKLPQPEKQR
jgi:hypothetical protein